MGTRVRQAQSTFTAGELSPLMAARSDIKPYRQGAAALRNYTPMSQGGVTTRPALRYMATVPAVSARVEGLPFALDQRYALVFSDGRMDAWTAAGAPCAPVTGAPWSASILFEMSVVVAGDTILLFHKTMRPARVRRTGATTFALDTMPVEVPPFDRYTDAARALTPSAIGAPGTAFTATFDAATAAPTWAGRQLRIRGKRALISSYTNAATLACQWLEDSTGLSTVATTEWLEEAWTPEAGYPAAGCFFGNRLHLVGHTQRTNAWCASKAGAYYNFDLGTAKDDEGWYTYVVGTQGVPRLRHVVASDRLVMFADQGTYFAIKSDGPLTPTNIATRQVSPTGASSPTPALFDGGALWIDQTGSTARSALWVETASTFAGEAVSLWAEHLVRLPRQLTAHDGNATRPEKLAVATNSDGTLAVLHAIAAENIQAWVPWDTDGQFLSVASCGTDLFAVVRRGSATFLERFDWTAAPLDAGARATLGSPGRTFAGFGHLAGRQVSLVSRGHYLGVTTVTGGGTVTLPDAALDVAEVEAGLPFTTRIRPMPIDADLGDGPGRGLMKRLMRVIIQTDRSGTFQVNGSDVLLSFQGDQVGQQASTVTGLVQFRMRQISRECQFDVLVPYPERVTILGITREVSVNG